MAEFSNQFHVIAIQEPKVIEEWEKIYENPENQFSNLLTVVKVKNQHYRILLLQNYIQDLFTFQIIKKSMETSI